MFFLMMVIGRIRGSCMGLTESVLAFIVGPIFGMAICVLYSNTGLIVNMLIYGMDWG